MIERPAAPEKLTVERGFMTKDFTALRDYVQRIPPAVIARTYYDPEEDMHLQPPRAMDRHLARMLDTLVQLAIAQATALAEYLRALDQAARPTEGTTVTFRMVTEAAQLAAAPCIRTTRAGLGCGQASPGV